MPAYNFETLSDYDFECLVRDLLQHELGITLETFTSGADSGIDLRYSRDTARTMIVQCKHYARSAYRHLVRSLRTELPKISALQPARYIVATSLPLTPKQKSEIHELLEPYCHSPQDVFGSDDLNNLLTKFPVVEQRHFKLWLTSTEVLQRVLNASIFSESHSTLERVKRRICIYVENESFHKAQSLLEKHHVCIITGIPGIGKTTLAEMLLIWYVDRGFEVVHIWNDISEIRRVFKPDRRQVFYYDDFLGSTGLQLAKNEDKRLLQLVEDIRRSPNHRLILTTREYILNQARTLHEPLNDQLFDTARYVVSLDDYSPYLRAKILYNHLFFSNLPRPCLETIVESAVYKRIIQHRNFNPRIIEWMTTTPRCQSVSPGTYISEL